MLSMILNHYFKFVFDILHRVGLKRTRQILYTTNSDDNVCIDQDPRETLLAYHHQNTSIYPP